MGDLHDVERNELVHGDDYSNLATDHIIKNGIKFDGLVKSPTSALCCIS